MIEKEKYIKNCEDAGIFLGHTEENILNDISEDGWFDPKAFLIRAQKVGYPITTNQKEIIEWMRTDKDSGMLAQEKEYVLRAKIAVMAKHNRHSIGISEGDHEQCITCRQISKRSGC